MTASLTKSVPKHGCVKSTHFEFSHGLNVKGYENKNERIVTEKADNRSNQVRSSIRGGTWAIRNAAAKHEDESKVEIAGSTQGCHDAFSRV